MLNFGVSKLEVKEGPGPRPPGSTRAVSEETKILKNVRITHADLLVFFQ